MINKLFILFWIRKNKRNSIGEAPIYCRITVNSKRAPDFSTGIKVPIDKWNPTRQVIRGDEFNPYNDVLFELRTQILKTRNQLESKQIRCTPHKLKDIVTGKEKIDYTILEIFEKYLEYGKKLLEAGEIEKGTYKNYLTRHKNITEFLTEKKFSKYFPEEIGPGIMDALKVFVSSEKNFARETQKKTVEYFKNVLDYAETQKFISLNPVRAYKVGIKRIKKKVFLRPPQLKIIRDYDYAVQYIQSAADLFIFCCYTGLTFADMEAFDPLSDMNMFDSRPYIAKLREKNRNIKEGQLDIIAPILPPAWDILVKYDFKLPVISNQKLNIYLKEVANITGIQVNLTHKIARKTFANLMINDYKVSLLSVSKMMGHSSTRVTEEYYLEILQERVDEEAIRLFEEVV
jgi:integrase/recombinase XerD